LETSLMIEMKKDADFISEEEFFVIKDYEEKARN
jgi:hypothetical protein